jgi:uncharacterized small protein (DUF1192 family)
MDDEEKLTNRPSSGNLPHLDFSALSVDSLRDYIAALHAEIGRAEAAIRHKDAARGHADSFFRKTSS